MGLDLDRAVRAELEPGEHLLWAGRPASGVRFTRAEVLLVPFGLLWGGLAFFWEYSVLRDDAHVIMALFGMPFVVMGIYVIAGRFLVDAYRRARTAYALTDQRVLIISDAWRHTVDSFALSSLSQIKLSLKCGRRGTISLGPSVGIYGSADSAKSWMDPAAKRPHEDA